MYHREINIERRIQKESQYSSDQMAEAMETKENALKGKTPMKPYPSDVRHA